MAGRIIEAAAGTILAVLVLRWIAAVSGGTFPCGGGSGGSGLGPM